MILFLFKWNGFVTRPSSTTNHSSGSILDLVLTNHEALIDNVTTRPGSFDSDHIPVTFTIKSSFKRLKNVSRKVYSHGKADFHGLRTTLSCIPWGACFSANDVNSSVESFQDLLFAAVNQHIPQIKLRRHSRPPWIDNDVMKLVRKKKSLWRCLKNNSDVGLFSRFKLLRKQTKRLISLKYCLYLKSSSEDLKNNPKKFWSFHSLKSKTKRIPPVVMYKPNSASDPAEKASLFNEFFSSVFTSTSADHVTSRNDVTHSDLLMSMSTSALEVQKILAKLDVNKATGADNIPVRILKERFRELSHPLSTLFKMSFRLGVVPQEWERANITPVFKSDNKNLVENYRSVSLLSVPSKCQEKVIYHTIILFKCTSIFK